MIETKNIKKIYKLGETYVHALNGVSVKIKKGQFVAITGPSGCGKSTFLHQLGLIDRPSDGTIIINDTDVTHLTEEQRTAFRLAHLGYVFQDYALLPELTGAENVYIPAMVRNVPSDKYLKKAEEILETVNLAHRGSHLPTEMSGGEQQRFAIARALINSPSILFADEPCANLDSKASEQVLNLFKKLNRSLKQTIVMVTHEKWHLKYADRVIKLKDGKLQ